MFLKRKKFDKDLNALNKKMSLLEIANTSQQFLAANILSRMNKLNAAEILQDIKLAEFKVFSQWGDDGIIDFLVDYLHIKSKTFIEFGVQDYTESNTRFLLMNKNWTGLIMDGSEENINYVKQDEIYWKYQLKAVNAFITSENINQLITGNGFAGEIGLLHIDIDGNDYWVWKAITCINPVIVIVEYNSVFGKNKPWTVPYKADFYRTSAHHSNLYFGSSLLSLVDFAEQKGYEFIGCTSSGNNAYFIRKDQINGIKPVTIDEGYVLSKFRESRDEAGKLTYLDGDMRLKELAGNPVYNTRTNAAELI